MVRIVTPTAAGKLAQNLGTEPIIVVKIEWVAGTEYYSEKTFTLDNLMQGAIKDFAAVSAQSKLDLVSEISSASITLIDTIGWLKDKVDTEIIEGLPVTIYQYFEGTLQSDMIPILTGKIVSDIVWDEGEHTLSFSCETTIEDEEVGYAPEEGAFADLHEDAVGVPWPICIGTPQLVPAVRIKKPVRGTLGQSVSEKILAFKVENADAFPQYDPEAPELVMVQIGEEYPVWCLGTFTNGIFTVVTFNVELYELTTGPRKVGNGWEDDASVIWLTTGTSILHKFVSIDGMTNFCTAQSGNRCTFAYDFHRTYEGQNLSVLIRDGETVSVAGTTQASWTQDVILPAPIVGMEYLNFVRTGIFYAPIADSGFFPAGTPIKLVSDVLDTYVCNVLPSEQVLGVYARKSSPVKLIEGNFDLSFRPTVTNISEYTKMTPVPADNFDIDLGTVAYDGQYPTTITFKEGLSMESLSDDGWDSEIFVTVMSSWGSNPAGAIQHLLEDYSNISVDSATFTAVKAQVGYYPANFAVLDRPNVLTLVNDIAWQIGCAIIIRDNTAYIKNLTKEPSAIFAVNSASVELKTMSLSFTETESIVTRLKAKWRKDYSGDEDVEKEYIYTSNVDLFGLKEEERDFFIYNQKELVELFADFWGYRLSNVWRKISYNTFLDGVIIDPFDTATYRLDKLSPNTIRGIIDTISHDTDTHALSIESTLYSKAGDVDGDDYPEEDSGWWRGDPSNPVDHLTNEIPLDGTPTDSIDLVPNGNDPIPEGGDFIPDDEDDGKEGHLRIEITNEPTKTIRGTSFTVSAAIKDQLNNPVSVDVSAALAFNPTNGSDVLNTTNIEFVQGVWTSAALSITGGSGAAKASIEIYASDIVIDDMTYDFLKDSTPLFRIVDAPSDTLTWDTSPASVTREQAFSVAISGGSAGLVLHVALGSTDTADRLVTGYAGNNITLNGSGEFSAADWYITGGNGSDVSHMTLCDYTYVYKWKPCDQYPITGLSDLSARTYLEITDKAWINRGRMIVTSTCTEVAPSYTNEFDFTATVYDKNDVIDTSFSGEATARVFEEDTEGKPTIELTWVNIQPGENHGATATVDIVNGVYTCPLCEIAGKVNPLAKILVRVTINNVDELHDETWVYFDEY